MISLIKDWIDRMVNPDAYEPLSINNNRYNQWGTPPEEQPMAVNYDPLAYQQNAGNQANTLFSAGGAGGWSAVTYPTAGTSVLMPGISCVNTVAGTIYIPPRTGSHFSILFVDAAGNHHSIVVDQAHIGIFQQMSGMPFPTSITTGQSPFDPIFAPSTKMLEGDFSFDEMEAAENLIAELSGVRNQGNEQGQETGCAT